MNRRGKVWQRGRKKDAPVLRGLPWYYVVDVEPIGAPRKQKYKDGFRTEADARRALNKVIRDVEEQTYVDASKVTVGEWLGTWLASLAVEGRKQSTIASYERNLRVHVRPTLGSMRLQALTTGQLDKLYAAMLQGGKRTGKGGPLAPRTVRYVSTVLGKALSDAVRKQLLVRSPASNASVPSAKSTVPLEAACWTPEETRTFLEAIATHSLYPLMRLFAMSGLRRGEAHGLRREDLDLDGAVAHVRQQLGVIGNELVFVDTPKSDAGYRDVELDAKTITVLRRHLTAQKAERVALGVGYKDHGLVFQMPSGEPYHPKSTSQTFGRMVKRTGHKRIRLHDLRHGHCAHMMAAGMDVKLISRRMGHGSVAFTLDRYGHLQPGAGADAAARVSALVDGAL